MKTAFSQLYSVHDPWGLGEVSGILAIFSTQTNVFSLQLYASWNRLEGVNKFYSFSLLENLRIINFPEQFEKFWISLKLVEDKLYFFIFQIQDSIDIIGDTLERLVFKLFITCCLHVFLIHNLYFLLLAKVNFHLFLWFLHQLLVSILKLSLQSNHLMEHFHQIVLYLSLS